MTRRPLARAAALASALVLVLVLAASASAAAPVPFGHPCTAANNVRFCPTDTLAQRVKTFDGVPLDVDVTLPPTGDGPFPTIVMLHGLGGSKTDFESAPAGDGGALYHYNNQWYASQGYAVVNLSARGYGRSCGVTTSRTADCIAAKGWQHLADQRYEVRDVQNLLGTLVDEGVAKADALGATGISYGGGQSMQLAVLRDKTRLPNGTFVPWKSPNGTPLSLAAAWPRWPWSDLAAALTPNGRFLDFAQPRASDPRTPIGVPLQAYILGLSFTSNQGYVAPLGVDPRADLNGWKAIFDAGEPYHENAQKVVNELSAYHSAYPLLTALPKQKRAPLLIESGWTDDLFPVEHALRMYLGLHRKGIAMQFGDLGHSPGTNAAKPQKTLNNEGSAFFARELKGRSGGPKDGSVHAFPTVCPTSAAAHGVVAATWSSFARNVVPISTRRTLHVAAGSGDPAVGKAFSQLLNGDVCKTVPAKVAKGTAVLTKRLKAPITLAGLPQLRFFIKTAGVGQLDGRLWDVAPNGKQRLVTRGVYRVIPGGKKRVRFELRGNFWRFAKGHTVKLELSGSDAPEFAKSAGARAMRLTSFSLHLPIREPPILCSSAAHRC